MENNKEDLEKTQEKPLSTDDMEITQPKTVVEEEEKIASMNNEEPKVNETAQESEMKTVQEQIIEPKTPIFSMEDAKSMAIEPERRMGRIEAIQKGLAQIFNPLINKLKGKESPELESNNEDRNVDEIYGNGR